MNNIIVYHFFGDRLCVYCIKLHSNIFINILNLCPFIIHKPICKLIGRNFTISVCGEFFSCFNFPDLKFRFETWISADSGVIAPVGSIIYGLDIRQVAFVSVDRTYGRTFFLESGHYSITIQRINTALRYKGGITVFAYF